MCVAVAVVSAMISPALAGDAPTVYRLTSQSSFVQGCFPPCLCPLSLSQDVRGTLTLTPAETDPFFAHYDVSDVNIFVSAGENMTHITGSGTYQIGGDFALVERLLLNLRINNGEVKQFDSGFVPVGSRSASR
jgi:hypothetical protein